LAALFVSGCQHTHLRHNTVYQAKTLSEIYEQQVLDNLAMIVHDAHALPFFAYPKDGSTNITDQATIAATPFRNFEHVFGINGSRTGLEQWGLTPVADPAKLQLMQCAYQRAVYGHGLSACSKCCENEKSFEGKPDEVIRVFDVKTGTPLRNPKSCEFYTVQLADSGDGFGHWTYLHSNGKTYPIDSQGNVTIEHYDCHGSCAISCGWVCHGGRHDVPDDHCAMVGHHCGTYVWVNKCHRQHLTQLALRILDYAVNDPAIVLEREKEVTLNIDRYGEYTNDESKRVGTVKAVIGIDDPISSLLVIDCNQKARDSSQVNDGTGAMLRYGLDVLIGPESTSPPTPAEASKIVIPKSRAVRPGDGYPNQFRIQRDLNALGR